MKPPPFDYHDPATLAEALDLLAGHENARLLAGGQSLMPMLNMRYVQPEHIIDINRLAELDFIRAEGEEIVIGSMTRQRSLEFDPMIARRCPLLREAIGQVGHRQTRNRGTVGGSLCHLDPAAEIPAVAMTLSATVEVAGPAGTRRIPMPEFPAFYMTPAIEPDEIATALRLTPWPAAHGFSFAEFARRHGDFAIASAAVLMTLSPTGDIGRLALTIGGLGPAPLRVAAAEDLLQGSRPDDDAFHAAAEICGGLEAGGDVHATPEYRRHLAATLAFRALCAARARASGAARSTVA